MCAILCSRSLVVIVANFFVLISALTADDFGLYLHNIINVLLNIVVSNVINLLLNVVVSNVQLLTHSLN